MSENKTSAVPNSRPQKQQKHFGEIVCPWIVALARESEIEIEGYRHKITDDFERHVLKQHGNERLEKARGHIAVTEDDLRHIDEIMNEPDIAAIAIFKDNKARVVLVKNAEHGRVLEATRGYNAEKIKTATATDANSALCSTQSAEGGGNLHRHGS